MRMISRRGFVGAMVAVGTVGFAGRFAFANPLGLPLGIQLYSVRQQMAEDLDDALAAVSSCRLYRGGGSRAAAKERSGDPFSAGQGGTALRQRPSSL